MSSELTSSKAASDSYLVECRGRGLRCYDSFLHISQLYEETTELTTWRMTNPYTPKTTYVSQHDKI